MPIFKEPLTKLRPNKMARNPKGNLEPRARGTDNQLVQQVIGNVKEIPNG